MIIKQPCIITSRLLPGITIGEATISIEYYKQSPVTGHTWYRCYIDIGEYCYSDENLKSGYCGGSLQEGLCSLFNFLSAFAESRRYGMIDSDNWDLFPNRLADWATQNSEEIGFAAYQLANEQGIILE